MVILDYQKKHHAKIIHACVMALRQGRVVAYPTDTSYGLAVDAANEKAVTKLYRIKGRNFKKPSSVVVPSKAYAKKLVEWNKTVQKLTNRFWPGALTIAAKVKGKGGEFKKLKSADGYLSLRMPKNQVALDLAVLLKKPITATSANLSGQPDCYSADDIVKQFSAKGGSASGGKKQKLKPDIVINFGRLAKRKPSTVAKIINEDKIEIVRTGPITETQIAKTLIEK